jgi:branched-subunit amino acid aminotransferase/4-amino-4-deoxychorismate lyase
MRSGLLPPAFGEAGAKVDAGLCWKIAPFASYLTWYKTLNYWGNLRAFNAGRYWGFDEVLSMTPDGRFWEGSRTNLFAIQDDTLSTCSWLGPILPGIMREFVLELAGDLSLKVQQVHGLTVEELCQADELFLTNAVRGIIPVSELESGLQHPRWNTPGPWTRKLQILVSSRLMGEAP